MFRSKPSSSARGKNAVAPSLRILLLSLHVGLCIGMHIERKSGVFGATVVEFDVSAFLKRGNIVMDFSKHNITPSEETLSDVDFLRDALHTHRFLHIPGQTGLTWQEQLAFVQLFGDAYDESSHANRQTFGGQQDPRVAVFSNKPEFGLTNVGTEGFHSDGNVVPIPHKANILFCESAIEGGDTLLAPLEEVAARLDPMMFTDIRFVSSHVEGLSQPLIYPHPSTGRRTMFFGLGSLSGRYTRHGAETTEEETEDIKQAIETAIADVGPYRHIWKAGDLMMIDNLAVAHKATPGTQVVHEDGVRVMRRVTLANKQRLRRRPLFSELPQRCTDEGLCLISLAQWVEYNGTDFASINEARELCKYAIHETADLAVLPTRELAYMAAELVAETNVPHWIFGTEDAESKRIEWITLMHSPGAPASSFAILVEDDFVGDYPWDGPSGQPNDCDGPGSEPCIFVGPYGNWFDFACEKKTSGGPEITWTDGTRKMYQLYPLCIVNSKEMYFTEGMHAVPGDENVGDSHDIPQEQTSPTEIFESEHDEL
jgi:alpha-ketoglutarate-dependent taurine dioxygenase